jgi:UDP-glucose 4-epimerase
MTKILITGVKGYIGSHLAKILTDLGYVVFGIDRNGSKSNFPLPLGFNFALCDITNKSQMTKLFDEFDFDVVINCAGLKSVSESYLKEQEYFNVNYRGVKILADLASRNKVKLFIQASTAAVYGELEKDFLNEDTSTLNPSSPYGISKLESEKSLRDMKDSGSLNSVSLRYFNVVGSLSSEYCDINGENLFPKIRKQLISNSRPQIYGRSYPTLDGTCERDYIHILDVVNCNIEVLKSFDIKSFPSVVNVGCGIPRSVLEVVNMFQAKLKTNLEVVYSPPRIGDISRAVASTELASEFFDTDSFRNFENMVESSI